MKAPTKENLGPTPGKILEALWSCADWTWSGLAWAFVKRWPKDVDEFITALKEAQK